MLCTRCQDVGKINWQSAREDEPVLEHHQSYGNLRASAENGCGLCELLKAGLLHWMDECEAQGWANFDIPASSSEIYLLEQDQCSENVFFIIPKYWGHSTWPLHVLDGFQYTCTTMKEYMYGSGPYFKLATQSRASFPGLTGRVQSCGPDLDLAATWLRRCQSRHGECNGNRDGHYPRRILRLGNGGTDAQMALLEPSQPLEPYATLSHCWGSIQPLKTTFSNYDIHKNGIDISQLPRSFQDAVFVCKSLGIDYLWIDSLCIIQDSVDDWQRECPRMASIYSNSLITIAASSAADSSVGFLGDYPPPLFPSVALSSVVVEYPKPNHEAIGHDWYTLLSERAWALQERLLSPRVLSFRGNRLAWECNHHTCSDDQHYPISVNRFQFAEVGKRQMDNLGGLALLEYWYEVVMTYAACKLSRQSDKLPGLSGLANKVSKQLRKRYLAGIWQEDAVIGLSWGTYCECAKGSSSFAPAEQAVVTRGPSWSWAKCACQVLYRTDLRDQKREMRLVSVDISLAGLDPFGEVTAGNLRVASRLRVGVIGVVPERHAREYRLFDSHTNRAERAAFMYDCDQALRFYDMGLDDGIQVSALLMTHGEMAYTSWIALALEPVVGSEGQAVYRRVGLLLGQPNKSKEYEAASDWFDGCEVETVDIV